MSERYFRFAILCAFALCVGCNRLPDDNKALTNPMVPVQSQEAAQLQPEPQTDSLVVYREINQDGEKIRVALACDENEWVSLQVADKNMELFQLNQMYGQSQWNPSLFVFEKYIVIPEVMQYEGGLVYGSAMWVYEIGTAEPVRVVTDTQKIRPERLLQWYTALSAAAEGTPFHDYALIDFGYVYDRKNMAYLELYTYLDNTGDLCLLAPSSQSADAWSVVCVEKVKEGAAEDSDHFYGAIRTVEDSSNENTYALLTLSFAGASSSPVSSWLYNVNTREVSEFVDFNYSPDMRCTLTEDGENLVAVFPDLQLTETIPRSEIDDEVLAFLREHGDLNGETLTDDFFTRSPEQIVPIDSQTIAVWQRTSRKWMNRPIVTYFTIEDGKKNLLNYEFRKDFLSMGEYIQN